MFKKILVVISALVVTLSLGITNPVSAALTVNDFQIVGSTETTDVKITDNNEIYVATWDRKLTQLDANGVIQNSWSNIGWSPSSFTILNGYAYIASTGIGSPANGHTIARINLSDKTASSLTPTFADTGSAIALGFITTYKGELYVSARESNKVLRINATTGATIATYTVGATLDGAKGQGQKPGNITFSGNYAYVSTTDRIERIDLTTGNIDESFLVLTPATMTGATWSSAPHRPFGLQISGSNLWFGQGGASGYTEGICKVDISSGTAGTPTCYDVGVGSIALTITGNYLYSTTYASNKIARINIDTGVVEQTYVTLGTSSGGQNITAKNGAVWVPDYSGSKSGTSNWVTKISLVDAPSMTLDVTTVSGETGKSLKALNPTNNNFAGTVTYSIYPDLPEGLTLNPATGEITGTSKKPLTGTKFTLMASSENDSVTADFTLTITGDDITTITSPKTASIGTIKKTVYFEPESSALTPAAKKVLNALAKKYKTGVTIDVSGYVQNAGSKSNNKALSTARAKAIAQYLKSKGVKVTITTKGMGLPSRNAKLAKARKATLTITPTS